MNDIYLSARKVEKLADGESVLVKVDGESVWVHGSHID
jgi:hypothetical protein